MARRSTPEGPAGSFVYDAVTPPIRVHWSVRRGMIIVTSGFNSKTTQVGGSPPEALARQMAIEVAGAGAQVCDP